MSAACIDENAIGALFDHKLTPAEAEAIDQHVSKCKDCRDLLASMARLYAPSAPSGPVPVTSPFGPTVTSPGPKGGDATIRRLLTMLGSDARIGRILAGKWRIDELLGVGGMAEVYAATHVTNGRRAAIKLLRRESLARPNIVYRFLREGYVANRVNHPGAVTILDDGTADDGTPFLVLELLDGKSIGDNVKKDRLPVSDILRIAHDVLDVLAAAHAQGIIHRDIKPDNILRTRAGQVKVLDFGIARLSESQATQLGHIIGTPAYMPPEQATGDAVIDARADVWALGATMFALLARRTVHDGKGPYAPAPKIATVVPNLDPIIGAIVDRALEFEPDHRWPDARSMQEALRAALAGEVSIAPVSVGPRFSIAPEIPMKRGLPWKRALLLIAAAAGGYVMWSHKPPPMQPEPVMLASPPPPPAASAVLVSTEPAPIASTVPASSAKPKRHVHHDAKPEPAKVEPVAAAPAPAPPPPAPVENAHPLDRRD
jgi:serine/threonine-protein kinase